MKKKLAILCLLMMLLTLITACTEEPTAYTEKGNYSVGERIIIRDNVSNGELGWVTVTDIRIVSDEPFVYCGEEYEALGSISYVASTLDSSRHIDCYNFSIYDFNGDPAVQYGNIEENGFTFALKKKGEVFVDFNFHVNEDPITTIKGVCGEMSEETRTVIEQNNSLKILCIVLFLFIVILIVLMSVFAFQKNEKIPIAVGQEFMGEAEQRLEEGTEELTEEAEEQQSEI